MEGTADDARHSDPDHLAGHGFGVISVDAQWADQASRELEVSEVAPLIAEVIDLALLDRLLGVQEAAALAVADAEKAETEVSGLTRAIQELQNENEASRSEIETLRERLDGEHRDRALAEARNVELENRLRREEQLAQDERVAAHSATQHSLRREREAALAAGAMGWWSRRRLRRLQMAERVV